MSERVFINELGNRIALDVSLLEVSGTPGACIRLEGPTSTSENFITLKEAQELHAALSAALQQ